MRPFLWLAVLCFCGSTAMGQQYPEKLDDDISLVVITYSEDFKERVFNFADLISNEFPEKVSAPGVVSGLYFIALDGINRDDRAYFGAELTDLPPLFAILQDTPFEGNHCAIKTIAESDGETYFALLVDTEQLRVDEAERCIFLNFAFYLGVTDPNTDINSLSDLRKHLNNG